MEKKLQTVSPPGGPGGPGGPGIPSPCSPWQQILSTRLKLNSYYKYIRMHGLWRLSVVLGPCMC